MSLVCVQIHSSQFPGNVRQDLLDSIRTRQVNHKFHYDSIKQTQKWLELHAAYSPSRTDPECGKVYDQSFQAAAAQAGAAIHVVGLGCGGGQKDARLLRLLKKQGKSPAYTPSDVSVAMVIVAQQVAAEVIDAAQIYPLVADISRADDLAGVLCARPNDQNGRLITFFGMIPNFEPDPIVARLATLVRPQDLLLFSANLAPGNDYARGVEQVLPLYDNRLTHDWLLTFLLDLGVERADGELRFTIEEDPDRLRRITATFVFSENREVAVGEEKFRFSAGDKIRLFFSYRHTPVTVKDLLGRHGLTVRDRWITSSQEEGVFLCSR